MERQCIRPKDIERIHEESLYILSKVGVKFEHDGALEVFKRHGARVDGQTVHLNSALVEKYIKEIPKSFTLQSSKGDSVYGKGDCHKTPIAGNIYIQKNGKIMKMTNQDVIDQFKLSDTSDVIDTNYFNNFLDTQGFTEDQKVFGSLAMHLKYSNKIGPLNFPNVFGRENTGEIYRKGIQLIRKFEGVKNTYLCMVSINTLSPLCYDHDPIEKIFIASEENQPVWISACAMPLLTAPPSVFGMLSMSNAEVLAGLVLAQMLRPGIPCVYGNTSGSTNMRTIQLSIGSPEAMLVTYYTKSLADYYHLPCRAGGALSDAKDFDFQSGAESTMLLMATLDAKPDFIFHACGGIGSFNVVSFEKFLADEEIIRMYERVQSGVDVSIEKGCVEMIEKVGPRGTFLKGRTPKMFREEFFLPKCFNKEDPNQWMQKGSIPLSKSLNKAILERIDQYVAPEITKEQARIVAPFIPEPYLNGI